MHDLRDRAAMHLVVDGAVAEVRTTTLVGMSPLELPGGQTAEAEIDDSDLDARANEPHGLPGVGTGAAHLLPAIAWAMGLAGGATRRTSPRAARVSNRPTGTNA